MGAQLLVQNPQISTLMNFPSSFLLLYLHTECFKKHVWTTAEARGPGHQDLFHGYAHKLLHINNNLTLKPAFKLLAPFHPDLSTGLIS